MSAYLCNPIHIAMLTECMTKEQPRTHNVAVRAWYSDHSIDVVATDLAIQNWQTVVNCYGNEAISEQYKTCGDYVGAVLHALRLVSDSSVNIPLSRQTGLLSCYEYQAYETPPCKENVAYKYCQKLRRVLYNEMAEELAAKTKRPTGWDYTDLEYSDDLISV